MNHAGVSCKGGNCIQTGATAKGATDGVTCEGGGCVGTPPKPAPVPPKPAPPKPPAPPAPKPPAPKPAPAQNDEDEDEDKPPAPKPAPAKPTSLFAKPAAPLKTKLCTDPAQIWCILEDKYQPTGVIEYCGTSCGGHNMGQPGKHGPVGHPADGDWCTNSNANEQACKSAPGECTWLTGLPAGSDTCVYFPPGQAPPAAAKPATPKPANGG